MCYKVKFNYQIEGFQMAWGLLLLVAYIVTCAVVVDSESKITRALFMTGWIVLALLIGHFAWHVF